MDLMGETKAVRTARWLRRIADWLDPFGSGDLDKMRVAGDRALESMRKRRIAWEARNAGGAIATRVDR